MGISSPCQTFAPFMISFSRLLFLMFLGELLTDLFLRVYIFYTPNFLCLLQMEFVNGVFPLFKNYYSSAPTKSTLG